MKRDATFDTSFWANAFRVGLLPYVLARFALRYTPDVATELPDTNPPGREFRRLAQAGDIAEIAPEVLHIREFGAGERAAMSVAIEHPDWVLLLDDYRPYRVALDRGMSVVCTPLLAVALYDEGVLSEVQVHRILDRLEGIGTVSPRLLGEARNRLRS